MAPSPFGWMPGSAVCLHNAIVARCILDTNIALWDTQTASAPSILLILLEPYYVVSVFHGTSGVLNYIISSSLISQNYEITYDFNLSPC